MTESTDSPDRTVILMELSAVVDAGATGARGAAAGLRGANAAATPRNANFSSFIGASTHTRSSTHSVALRRGSHGTERWVMIRHGTTHRPKIGIRASMGQPAEAEAASLLDNNAAPPPQRTPRKAVVAGLALLAAVTAATARATRPAPRLASNAMDIAVTGPYGANTAAQYPFLASGRYDALVEPHASTELRVAGAPRSAASASWTFGDGRAAPSGFAVMKFGQDHPNQRLNSTQPIAFGHRRSTSRYCLYLASRMASTPA